jgi:hypothetical protein
MPFARNRKLRRAILLAFALAFNGCAPLQPPSATGPKGNEPVYPVLFKEDIHRRDAVITAINKLLPQPGGSPTKDFELQPITATIERLPSSAGSLLYLPKLGAAAVMNEEETRESLRRFIKESQELIGADPAKLSLVERLDQPDGTKLANYEQRPFRYPIRGNYGKLQIRFTTDRRIVNILSSCIPDADRIQTALAAAVIHLKAEDAIKQLRESDIMYTDSKGSKLSLRASAAGQITPRELVTYILPSQSQPDALEFHIAWEVELTNSPVKMAYVDAFNGQVIAAE